MFNKFEKQTLWITYEIKTEFGGSIVNLNKIAGSLIQNFGISFSNIEDQIFFLTDIFLHNILMFVLSQTF